MPSIGCDCIGRSALLTKYFYDMKELPDSFVAGCPERYYPRLRIENLADTDPKVARELREIALRAVSRIENQLLILGRITY